jgi:hypothetical protein
MVRVGRLFDCAIVMACSVLACGGRTEAGDWDSATEHEAGLDSGVPFPGNDGSGDEAVQPTCSPDGVRLCGGRCPDAPCDACGRLFHEDGTQSAYGICWSDLADFGNTPCALCDENEGCVERAPQSFVCVPLLVCDALRALGAGPVCWYGDKVPFEAQGEAVATGCPSDPSIQGVVCGGDCPACADGTTLSRCVGRGPSHPFGACPVLANAGSPTEVGNYPTCALSVKGSALIPCPSISYYPYSCAVSPNPPGDPIVARLSGYCISTDICKSLSALLPGGLWCYDASGARIAP